MFGKLENYLFKEERAKYVKEISRLNSQVEYLRQREEENNIRKKQGLNHASKRVKDLSKQVIELEKQLAQKKHDCGLCRFCNEPEIQFNEHGGIIHK